MEDVICKPYFLMTPYRLPNPTVSQLSPLTSSGQEKKYMDMETQQDRIFKGRQAFKKVYVSRKRKGLSRNYDGINKPMRKKKTNFERYLELENQNARTFSKEALDLDIKLAKQLGMLGEDDDGINMLLEGIPSVSDFEENTDVAQDSRRNILRKNNKKRELDLDGEINSDDLVHKNNHAQASVMENHAKYVPPQLRSVSRNESEEFFKIRKRVRGLLNRLGESNVEGTTGEMFSIFQFISCSDGTRIISEEILTSCSEGPRAIEQYAAVFAALVSGLACLVGINFGAKLLASLAKCFEDEYKKEGHLSLRNLTLLLSYLYIFGVCSSDLVYDFMMMLSSRLTELDVSTILIVLNCCGMRLRSDDPSTMKIFIISIQNKVTELEAASGNTRSKRMEFMLETIFDIKNNKKTTKEEHTRVKKWLQKLGVGSILVRGLKWSTLLDPEKKGQWWLSSSTTNSSKIECFDERMDKESTDMFKLAGKQRMNTSARWHIFCIIINAEDYLDAFEKLLRLDLLRKQARETMRVLVECCLQEELFNKYYCLLASKLCNYDKNNKITLQYCLWDHYMELESMHLTQQLSQQTRRSFHLAKFTAEMVSDFTLSLAVLKKADLQDTSKFTDRKRMHFMMLFEALFEYPDTLVWNIFKRISGSSQYETLRTGIKLFIKSYVVIGNQKHFAEKYRIAKKALDSVEDPFS